ncbi:hypothetical protein ACGFX8_10255 [Streptomyces sp. NPDC048362]
MDAIAVRYRPNLLPSGLPAGSPEEAVKTDRPGDDDDGSAGGLVPVS